MSRKTGKSQAAVERLLEERRQYEAWIKKLSAPGSSGMPAHVVDRVRSDYRNRLDDVTRQLTRHTKELEANLGTIAIVGAGGGAAKVSWGVLPLECDLYIPMAASIADPPVG